MDNSETKVVSITWNGLGILFSLYLATLSFSKGLEADPNILPYAFVCAWMILWFLYCLRNLLWELGIDIFPYIEKGKDDEN